MDEIDELLEGEDGTEETPNQSKDNAAFAQMRKELRALKKEAEELRAFRAEKEKEARVADVSKAFTELGLNPKHAKFFAAEGDITPDVVKAWALENDFLARAEGEEDAPPPEPASPGFTPTVLPDASTPGSKTYTTEEFAELLKSDPRRAEQVYKAGRLKKEEPNWKYQSRLYGRDT